MLFSYFFQAAYDPYICSPIREVQNHLKCLLSMKRKIAKFHVRRSVKTFSSKCFIFVTKIFFNINRFNNSSFSHYILNFLFMTRFCLPKGIVQHNIPTWDCVALHNDNLRHRSEKLLILRSKYTGLYNTTNTSSCAIFTNSNVCLFSNT